MHSGDSGAYLDGAGGFLLDFGIIAPLSHFASELAAPHYMSISCLAVTGHSDLPETHFLIGLFKAGIAMEVLCSEDAPHRQLLLDNQVPVTTLELKKRRDKAGIQLIQSRLASRQFHSKLHLLLYEVSYRY